MAEGLGDLIVTARLRFSFRNRRLFYQRLRKDEGLGLLVLRF